MSDRRDEILKYELSIFGGKIPDDAIVATKYAMDSYMEERCLDLLEYVSKNIGKIDRNGDFVGYRGDVFTKEQLFENFL